MAQEIALGAGLRVTCELTFDGEVAVNRWHTPYQGSPASFVGVSLAFRTFYAAIGSLLPTDVTYSRIRIATHSVGGWVQQYEESENQTGAGAAALPRQVAMRGTLTPDKDPSERPRHGGTYIGPLDVTTLASNGRFTAAACSVLNTALVNLDDQLEASSGVWGLGVYWTVPLFEDLVRRVIKIETGDVPDTQRSRRSAIPEFFYDAGL